MALMLTGILKTAMLAIVAFMVLSVGQSGVTGQLMLGSLGGNLKPCELICDDTYGTKDKTVLELSFCKRGCRLLSIVDFINDAGTLDKSKNTCIKSCKDAYSGFDNSSACAFGCESQLPTAEMRRKQMASFFNDEQDFFSPLSQMQQYYSRMMNCVRDQVQQRVVLRWSVFSPSSAEGTRIIVFGAGTDNFNPAADYKTSNYVETNLAAVDNSATPNFKSYQAAAMDGTLLEGGATRRAEDSDWLSCLSRRTSLSKQSVILLVGFSVVLILWFCLGLVIPSRQQTRVTPETQKLSIYGDLDYLYDIDDKAMLAYLSPKEPSVMAAPLPIKVHIDKI